MASDKSLFAPLPLRAMAHELSGLQLRVLACVTAHDRMSLVTGKGQGCWSSNERMRTMVGCSYARVCSTLSELTEDGAGALPGGPYLRREKIGRHTAYRVLYTEADKLLFGNVSDRQKGCQSASKNSSTCCEASFESGENLPETSAQYIPLSGGIDFEKSRKDSSTEVARLSARQARQEGLGQAVGAQLAQLERRLRDDPHGLDTEAWIVWLDDIRFDQNEFPANVGRATRLQGELIQFQQALGEFIELVAVDDGGLVGGDREARQ